MPTHTLRILHVSPYSPDAWAYGGIPRLVGTLTREMARHGHKVTLCVTDVKDRSSRLSGGRRDRVRDGADWQVFPNVSNRLAYACQFYTPVGLSAYLRRHAGSFDIAHLHACRNLPGVIAAYHLTRAGVPYIVAPNGTAGRVERFLLAKRAFDLLAGNRVMRGAASVLAVSGSEEEQLRALGIPETVLCTIPNPVDLDEFSPAIDRGAFRARAALGSSPLVLFLGKLTSRKRVDVLIRAVADLERTDARLVIAGNDMGAGREARALAESLTLSDRIVFTGLLQARERLEALADADVLVYPSEHEIFGLVPLEALLCGTPVIVGADSGCGEVIRAVGGGQVIAVGDAGALATAIRNVLDAPDAWRARAREAAARVRAAYSGDLVAARVVALYRTLIEAPGRSPATNRAEDRVACT